MMEDESMRSAGRKSNFRHAHVTASQRRGVQYAVENPDNEGYDERRDWSGASEKRLVVLVIL
jgi:hypothetical protein